MKRLFLILAVAIVYILHQDFLLWRSPALVFGVIPIGLFYHAFFAVAASALMWLLVTFAWPSHLEEEVEHRESHGEDKAR